MTKITRKIRAAVMERDGGMCRYCGLSAYREMGPSVHHRINRGAGGSIRIATLAELVLLCGTGATGCHGFVTENPAWAYGAGWSIRRNSLDDPEQIPLVDAWGYQTLLTDDGAVISTGHVARATNAPRRAS